MGKRPICGSTPLGANHQGDVKISFDEGITGIRLYRWCFPAESHVAEQPKHGQPKHFLQDVLHIETIYVSSDPFYQEAFPFPRHDTAFRHSPTFVGFSQIQGFVLD
jgi:hypothetical protein